jgi:Serine dehydrogenase proteinase
MPTWGELLAELSEIAQAQAAAQATGAPPPTAGPVDLLRRKYLQLLHRHTQRAVIYYGVAWHETRPINPQTLSVDLGDIRGFMEACSNIHERQVDLILHSPGGNPDAAESIMAYLRQRFDHIRGVVPLAAMSAATMMALGSDELLMGEHSQLGPVDPQITVTTPEGPRTAPAQAIKDQFDMPNKSVRTIPLASRLGCRYFER